ncbi:MAG: serine--tRNA ligase [Verrucomicrobia bacterium]|nr:serine--tRNA ligase [Verrucomicrobiota bacterium]
MNVATAHSGIQIWSFMLDLKYLRERMPEISAALATKKFAVDLASFERLDGERRTMIRATEELRAQQKAANGDMSRMAKGSAEFLAKVAELKQVSSELKEMQVRLDQIENEWRAAYIAIPNVPDASVPVGKTEDDNVVFATWGDPAAVSAHALPHWEIPGFSDKVDLPRGTKVTGAGFPFFVGDMARLVRSLLQFFLEENSAAGFVEMMPPVVVNAASATATGQLPDKEGQMYYAAEDELYLIPTAEVPVTNYYRDEIFEASALPVYASAYTPCFRREAGSYGKDVRGLNRLHQFDKVEVVKWVHPDRSFAELESLREHAESLLRKLELPYRTLLMCTGDIGFPHSKQYDLEVWAGGQRRWLEVSSCSNFTDFQARRANIRFRDEDGKIQVVHTLNGSALAIPRVLAALLENNLSTDGKVRIPEVLRPWFKKEFLQF